MFPLAHVTGNRVVGVAGPAGGFHLSRIDWESRGRRMDECIRVVRGALSGNLRLRGRVLPIRRARMKPVPTNRSVSSWAATRAGASAGGAGGRRLVSPTRPTRSWRPRFRSCRATGASSHRRPAVEIHAFDVMLADTAGVERLPTGRHGRDRGAMESLGDLIAEKLENRALRQRGHRLVSLTNHLTRLIRDCNAARRQGCYRRASARVW
jgi:hypothetical protein